MRVFDFDNTIYDGESSIDFAFYMIRNFRKIILYIPMILFSLAGYKMCIMSREKLESVINRFFAGVMEQTEKTEIFVNRFWEKNARKLNRSMLELIRPEDIIISASPIFLFGGIRGVLNTENIIGTDVDFERKRITWLNFGENKLKRYREMYGDKRIDMLFTDSYNDKDLMMISRKIFIVKKGVIVKRLVPKKR